jgi:hypothetical protein
MRIRDRLRILRNEDRVCFEPLLQASAGISDASTWYVYQWILRARFEIEYVRYHDFQYTPLRMPLSRLSRRDLLPLMEW